MAMKETKSHNYDMRELQDYRKARDQQILKAIAGKPRSEWSPKLEKEADELQERNFQKQKKKDDEWYAKNEDPYRKLK